MKRNSRLNVFTTTLVVVSLMITACSKRGEETTTGSAGADSRGETAAPAVDPVKRGEYLVTIGGCHDCHTPFKITPTGPAPDMDRMLSGHPQDLVLPPPPPLTEPWMWAGAMTNTAFAGPWGISYALNLTPDQNTGIGIWTEELFLNAMRTGKHFGTSRPIMPPMPWQNLSRATDEDLKAIFAYLKSIRPIENRVPEYQPPQGQGAPPAAPAS